MLAKAYFNIRNACRFILGNLADFNPDLDRVAPETMPEIDRLILHKLQVLIRKVRQAYEEYEFYTIYHLVNNFTTVDLSAFYHDVLKDRLYTSAAASPARRSAQATMFEVLTALVRLLAPILSFTAEEVWRHLPDFAGKADSVHLTEFPDAHEALIDDDLAQRWDKLRTVRGEVTKALEAARREKIIGHPLDAEVTLVAEGELYDFLKGYQDDLRPVFIVSRVEVKQGPPEGFVSEEAPGLGVVVGPSPHPKCPRCWVREETVGLDAEGQPVSACERCQRAMDEAAG
jgi:isoleucyl-tRNA synthetase